MIETRIDADKFRRVMGCFPTGVTVVTTLGQDGHAYGLTANSFSSVSLDPPLVLWSLKTQSRSFAAFRDCERFAVSILSTDQAGVSTRFAGNVEDRFDGVPLVEGLFGIPLIDGAAANIECRKVATYPGGDHAIFLGQAERIRASGREPLAFLGGSYMALRPHLQQVVETTCEATVRRKLG